MRGFAARMVAGAFGLALAVAPGPLTAATPVIVPAAGFVVQKTSTPTLQHWLKMVNGHPHAVDIRVTTDPSFATVGTDLSTLGPQIVDKMKAGGYTIERSGPRALCGGRQGYEIHGTETTGIGLLREDIVLAVAHSTLYEAVYAHDITTASLPEALGFIASLCPR